MCVGVLTGTAWCCLVCLVHMGLFKSSKYAGRVWIVVFTWIDVLIWWIWLIYEYGVNYKDWTVNVMSAFTYSLKEHFYCCLVNFCGQDPVISIDICVIRNFVWGLKISSRSLNSGFSCEFAVLTIRKQLGDFTLYITVAKFFTKKIM